MAKKKKKLLTILLVEDEESLAIGLEYNLIEEGYSVIRAENGREALELFGSQKTDLVVLDIMIPYIDGFEVAKRIRAVDPQLPILILTARTGVTDKVYGLELGADDYLTKPFHLQELLLRIEGMLRRKAWYQSFDVGLKEFSFGGNTVNFENLQCTGVNGEFRLTQLEAALLKYLISNTGRIIPRHELLEKVWNISSAMETRTVDNFKVRLRKYFEVNPNNPVYILSVRSAGYMFKS